MSERRDKMLSALPHLVIGWLACPVVIVVITSHLNEITGALRWFAISAIIAIFLMMATVTALWILGWKATGRIG